MLSIGKLAPTGAEYYLEAVAQGVAAVAEQRQALLVEGRGPGVVALGARQTAECVVRPGNATAIP